MKNQLNIFYKRKKMIAIAIILGLVIGLFFSLAIKPRYEATIELAVQPADTLKYLSLDNAALTEYINYQVNIIKSNAVTNDVINKLNLGIGDVLNRKHPETDLLKFVKIKTAGKTIIKITARAKTPQLAAGIASQFAASYIKFKKEERFSLSNEAKKWLKDASSLSKDLGTLKTQMLEFKKDIDMVDPDKKIADYQFEIEQLYAEKEEFLKNSKKDEKVLDKIKKLSQVGLADAVKEGADYSFLSVLDSEISEYKSIQSEIDALLLRYKPDHPRIVELNKKKAVLLAGAYNKIKESITKLHNQIHAANEHIKKTDEKISDIKSKYAALIEKKKKYDVIKSKLGHIELLYKEANAQLDNMGFEIINTSILGFSESGGAPTKKIQPLRTFVIIFSIAGLFIGCFISYFLERSSIKPSVENQHPKNS